MHKTLIAGLALMLSISIIGFSSQGAFAQFTTDVSSVNLIKTVDKSVIVPGTTVNYNFVIDNTGTNTLRCDSLLDSQLGQLITTPQAQNFIQPGATRSFGPIPVVLNSDTTNTATVTCVGANGNTFTSTKSVTVDVVNPTATLMKTAQKTQVIDGQQITYDFKATRTDNDNVGLNNCQVVDATIGYASGPFILPSQNSMFSDTSGLVTINNPGLTNTATLNCNIETTMGDPFQVLSNQVQVVTVDISGLSLDKMVTKNQVIAGQTVDYSFQADNSAGTFALQNCVIQDNDLPFTSAPFNLAAGAVSAVIPGPQNVPIPATSTNTATVTCFEPITMNNVDASDSETVTVVDISGLVLDKMVTKNQVVAGQTVDYSFKVDNTAGTFDLEDCEIVDNDLIFTSAQFDLAAGAMTTIPGPQAHQIDATFTNSATVTCNEPITMNDVSASDSETVTVVDISGLVLDKMVTKNQVVAGQTVDYSFKVDNTAGTFNLVDCEIVDNDLPFTSAQFDLAAGAMTTIPGPQTVQIDATFTNSATVTCFESITMNNVQASDSETVTVVDISGLQLVKDVNGVPGPISVPPGTVVTFNFKATNNNANFDYMNCQINDPLLGGNLGATFNLAKGGGMDTSVSEMVQINADMTNKGTITCIEDVTMQQVTVMSNEVTVTVALNPDVDIIKTASPSLIEEGETVTYTYDVTNIGDVPLTNCNIVDDKLGPIGTADFPLGLGNSETFQKTADIFVDTKNTATVTCTGAQQVVQDMDMATVTILVVGGNYLPIDSTSLLLAGIQSSAMWMLPAIAGIAGAGAYYIRFRMNKD